MCFIPLQSGSTKACFQVWWFEIISPRSSALVTSLTSAIQWTDAGYFFVRFLNLLGRLLFCRALYQESFELLSKLLHSVYLQPTL